MSGAASPAAARSRYCVRGPATTSRRSTTSAPTDGSPKSQAQLLRSPSWRTMHVRENKKISRSSCALEIACEHVLPYRTYYQSFGSVFI